MDDADKFEEYKEWLRTLSQAEILMLNLQAGFPLHIVENDEDLTWCMVDFYGPNWRDVI